MGSAIALGMSLLRWFVGSEAGRLVLVVVVAAALGFVAEQRAWHRGYAAHETEMAEAAAAAERKRTEDDARLQGLSDAELCRDYLRARGMPIDACDQLRGVSGGQSEP